MSEKTPEQPAKPEAAAEPKKENVVVMMVTCNLDTGQIGVSGPLDNKMLCYGMIGKAMETVLKYEPRLPVPPKKAGLLQRMGIALPGGKVV